MPPIWSVESDDPNLAAVLERLVDIKKGNTLVRGWARVVRLLPVRPVSRRHPVRGDRSAKWVVLCFWGADL